VKWAFKDGEEEKYSNLVKIGKEIVKKCAGVILEQKKDDILPALKLSYDQIPLRHCLIQLRN
jgi:hypothetical protein